MRTNISAVLSAFCAAACLTMCQTAEAHTTVANDPNVGGIDYNWTITGLEPGESQSLDGVTGSCSFRDPLLADVPLLGVDLTPGGYEEGLAVLPAENRGWTHTSQWVAFELLENSLVTVSLERKAGMTYVPFGSTDPVIANDELVPAFALWSGWDNDESAFEDIHFEFPAPPAHSHNWHVYNNAGNMAWAEDLSFIANAVDDGQALPGGVIPSDGFVSDTYSLPAGRYSLVVAGFVGPNGIVQQEGYEATVSVAAVPEPASLLLGVAALLIPMGARRVHKGR
ncbi:MAG: hypothetical protein JNL18_25040 [Planctomycetaceae bacterium]|nr:hypothetical protein [Planctomycetaceae bacterium]